jgi:hypothetical protein
MLATTRRPHPARSSGSGSPLPSLGEGLGERARLMGFTNRIWYDTKSAQRLLMLAITRRPLPALALRLRLPSPKLGRGVGGEGKIDGFYQPYKQIAPTSPRSRGYQLSTLNSQLDRIDNSPTQENILVIPNSGLPWRNPKLRLVKDQFDLTCI